MNPVVYLMHLNQNKYHQKIPEIPDTLGACGTSVLKPNVQTEIGMLFLPNLAYNPAELLNLTPVVKCACVCVCVSADLLSLGCRSHSSNSVEILPDITAAVITRQ